jgi:TorA maturation chaperone TorD
MEAQREIVSGCAATIKRWLDVAACFRFGALLFRPPAGDWRGELRALALELPSWAAETPVPESAGDEAAGESLFHRVIGPGGVPACESSYDRSALGARGPLLAGIAGSYRAFAFEPALDPPEVPDHLSVELDFLAYLALKVAFAEYSARGAEREVAERAFADFLHEHPAFWISPFRERVEAVDDGFYASAARWVETLCTSVVASVA